MGLSRVNSGHAGRGRVDRDRGLVVDPQHAAGIDGRTVAADEAARRGGAVAAGDLAQGEARDAGAVWSPTAEPNRPGAAPRRRPSPPNTRIWAAALSMIAKG